MISLSDDKQADIIDAFNTTTRCGLFPKMIRLIYFVEITSVDAARIHPRQKTSHHYTLARMIKQRGFSFLLFYYPALLRMTIHLDHVLCMLLLVINMEKLSTTQRKLLSNQA